MDNATDNSCPFILTSSKLSSISLVNPLADISTSKLSSLLQTNRIEIVSLERDEKKTIIFFLASKIMYQRSKKAYFMSLKVG